MMLGSSPRFPPGKPSILIHPQGLDHHQAVTVIVHMSLPPPSPRPWLSQTLHCLKTVPILTSLLLLLVSQPLHRLKILSFLSLLPFFLASHLPHRSEMVFRPPLLLHLVYGHPLHCIKAMFIVRFLILIV